MTMMHLDQVYFYPTWGIALLVIAPSIGGAIGVELIARRLIPLQTRQENNNVAAAMFSVIGVTFAVLLAFVVMLTFDGYSNARSSATAEAMVARDLADVSAGLQDPARSQIHRALWSYLSDVIEDEWPAQAAGITSRKGDQDLDLLNAVAAAYKPSSAADANYHASLLANLIRLQDARALRQLAASRNVPGVVWIVMLLGGALTVASASFLAAPSARMHLLMSATLAASGALVVVLIIALSQPFRGDIRVSAHPYQVVLQSLARASEH
jgi:hypothetical protein